MRKPNPEISRAIQEEIEKAGGAPEEGAKPVEVSKLPPEVTEEEIEEAVAPEKIRAGKLEREEVEPKELAKELEPEAVEKAAAKEEVKLKNLEAARERLAADAEAAAKSLGALQKAAEGAETGEIMEVARGIIAELREKTHAPELKDAVDAALLEAIRKPEHKRLAAIVRPLLAAEGVARALLGREAMKRLAETEKSYYKEAAKGSKEHRQLQELLASALEAVYNTSASDAERAEIDSYLRRIGRGITKTKGVEIRGANG